MPWVMELAPHNLSMASEASSIEDRAKPEPSSSKSLLQEGMALSVFTPLPDVIMVQETPPTPPTSWLLEKPIAIN